jgi:hypothetical protein
MKDRTHFAHCIYMCESNGRPLLRLQSYGPHTFMPRRAVPASPAAKVVGQVLQADLGARPNDADRAHDPTARRVLLRSEHMLEPLRCDQAPACRFISGGPGC